MQTEWEIEHDHLTRLCQRLLKAHEDGSAQEMGLIIVVLRELQQGGVDEGFLRALAVLDDDD
jgi:hypothetical protein